MRLIDAELIQYEPMLSAKGNGMYEDVMVAYKSQIDDLPTIEERKTGKWIIQDNPGTGWYRVVCSECAENVTSNIPMIGFFPHCKPLWGYCPYCGAEMEEEQE